MKRIASAAVAIALCTLAVPALAQEAKFGEKGTLAIHAATGSPMLESTLAPIHLGATPTLGFSTTRFSSPEDCNPTRCREETMSLTTFYVNPRIHYFVIDNLSIGGEVLFATFSGELEEKETRAGRTTTTKSDLDGAPTGFGLLPMIGYNIALGSKVSLWPHGGIGFRTFNFDSANPDIERDETWWFANLDLPFLLHIAEHFELGAGPGVTLTMSQKYSTRVAGVETTQSGYSTTAFRWFNAHLIGYF